MNAKLTMEDWKARAEAAEQSLAKLEQAISEERAVRDKALAACEEELRKVRDRIKRDIARLERKADEIVDSLTDEQREELNALSKRGVQ